MLDRKEIWELLEGYDLNEVKVGVIASHSALDVCDGAVEEGFRTLAVSQKGRQKTYTRYFKAQRSHDGLVQRGMVDQFWELDRFKDFIRTNIELSPDRICFS